MNRCRSRVGRRSAAAWFLRALALSVLPALLFLPGRSFAQASDDFDRGLNEFRAGNYSTAAKLFSHIEESSPGTTEALLYGAKCLIHLQDFRGAETGLRQYAASHPQSDDAFYLLGYVLNRENRPAESLEFYTKAARIRPPTGDDLKIVGLDYVLLNDYADAIKWLEKSVQLEAKNKEAWYYLGRAYYTQLRLSEAGRAFQTVLQLDPHDAKAENNLGLVFESQAQPEAAEEAYRKAIAWQAQSEHPSEQPYLNLGSLLLEQDHIADAIPALETAVKMAPNDATCHLRLGTAYLRAANLNDARRELEKSVQLAPDDPAAHYQLGKLYKQTHQMDKAKEEFDRTAELQSRAASSRPQ
jgi:tetratricopeptide (TPR) repeat protein